MLVGIRTLFLQSLERYVGKTQEIGIFLSGGVDSSILVAGLKEIGVPRVGTFTVGFQTPNKKQLGEDLGYAKLVAERFGTEHHEIVLRPGHKPVHGLQQIVKQLDDLIMTPNSYSRYLLARAAQRAGFNAVLGGMEYCSPPLAPKKRAKRLRKAQDGRTFEERFFKLRNNLFDLPTQQKLLMHASANSEASILEAIGAIAQNVECEDFFKRIAFTEVIFDTAEKSLRQMNNVGAMTGIELRSPFRDPALAEFATQLPASFDGGDTYVSFKSLMQKAFTSALPDEVLERRVIGFPCYYWNNGELTELQHRLLGRENIERMGVFNYDVVREILERDRRSEKKSAGKHSWALTQFALWHQEHFLGSDATRETEPAFT